MIDKIARFIVNRRLFIAVCILGITGFFLYQALHLPIQTYFPDLLPQHHPFIKLIKKHPKFGGTNTVIIGMEVLKGDLFTHKALQKLIDFSRELEFMPGVDRTKVISLGVNKVRNPKIESTGISSPPILFPEAPKTKKGIDRLRADVYSNPAYIGNLVSMNGKVALITMGFFEDRLKPRVVYKELQRLKKKYEDENTRIHIVGEPYLYGVIFAHLGQTTFFFIVTVVAMLLVSLVYTRSLRLILIPLASATICAIWGLGFMRLMHYNLDPLILVIPLLVSARALSHSIQFNWRINEDYVRTRSTKESCLSTIKGLFYPGLAGIITDATGIILISLIPIPLMTKLGLAIFVWCVSMIFAILIFNPVISLYLPPMRKAREWRDGRRNGFMEGRLLPMISSLNYKKSASWVILCCFFVMAVVAFYFNLGLITGDVHEGSPILKGSSQYNQDVEFMARELPGSMNPMLIIFEGKDEGVIKEPEVMKIADRFQVYMSKIPEVTMTLSIVNLIKGINMAFYENNPDYFVMPDSRRGIYANLHLLTSGGADPGDFDTYYDFDMQDLSIKIYSANHLPHTIDTLLAKARKFISENKTKFGEFKVAGGRIGVIAANNDSIVRYETITTVAAFILTGLLVALAFRSLVAGIILVIPLLLSTWFTFGYMAIQGIGLNLQTLPVSVIAIGIGVDYGVYLISRIHEEYIPTGDLHAAIRTAIGTAGNAVILTGIIIILGVVFWVFSDIKFQADMGILLSIVTFFHLLGTVVLLPAIVQIVRPRFILRRN